MERRVTPAKRVTSLTWGHPPPCKQALNKANVKIISYLALQVFFLQTLPVSGLLVSTILPRITETPSSTGSPRTLWWERKLLWQPKEYIARSRRLEKRGGTRFTFEAIVCVDALHVDEEEAILQWRIATVTGSIKHFAHTQCGCSVVNNFQGLLPRDLK